MKTFTIVLSFFCVCIFAQNPCEDARFTELKSIELDSMSQRQYEYFMLKEKECQKYNENKECTISFKMECSFEVPGVPQPSRKVFIDDVFVGDMPLNVKVSEGVHTISLYST